MHKLICTLILFCRDAYLICLIDSFTAAFAGFVIFAILGVMANEANTSVENVVEASMLIYFYKEDLNVLTPFCIYLISLYC